MKGKKAKPGPGGIARLPHRERKAALHNRLVQKDIDGLGERHAETGRAELSGAPKWRKITVLNRLERGRRAISSAQENRQ